MIQKFNFFKTKNSFFHRFGFPFIILILLGTVLYLVGAIGKINDEKKSIQALIENSEPTHVIRLPQSAATKKWSTFYSGFGGLRFKYPPNWRIVPGSHEKIVREGEGALLSVEASNAEESGESMIAYRVARISALQDLGYSIVDIAKTLVADHQALVFEGEDSHGGALYEAAFLKQGIFYTFTLFIKSETSVSDRKDSIEEYQKIISTISFQ